jgi:hypothetical protein
MQFYTYLWLREDGTPYYVGKGKNGRAFRKGSPPLERILVQEFPSEADAFDAEKFLIDYYGRKDCLGDGLLINHTDGGEGGTTNLGKTFSADTRAKMRQWQIGRKMSAEAKRNMSVAHKGVKLPPDRVARHRIKMLGHTTSDETRRKISEANKRRWAISPDRKLKDALRRNGFGRLIKS